MALVPMSSAVEGEIGSSEAFNALVTNVDDLHTRVTDAEQTNVTQDQWITDHAGVHSSVTDRLNALRASMELPGEYGGEWKSVGFASPLAAGSHTFSWWDTEVETPNGVTLLGGSNFRIDRAGLWTIDSSIEWNLSAEDIYMDLWDSVEGGFAVSGGSPNGHNVAATRRFATNDEFYVTFYLVGQESIRVAELTPQIRMHWLGD